MAVVRVFVVDDHELFRETAAAVVAATDGFRVVGTAASAEEATRLIAGLDVDLVLMDVNLPGKSGIDATRELTDGRSGPAVVLLSTYDESALDWADCGAADYIAKSAFSPSRLVTAWQAARPPR